MDKSYEFFLALHLYSLYASGFLMFFYLVLTQGNFKPNLYLSAESVCFYLYTMFF